MLQSQFAIDETNISPGVQEDMESKTSTKRNQIKIIH